MCSPCSQNQESGALLHPGKYKASCGGWLTARQVAKLTRNERSELICSRCAQAIRDQFSSEGAEIVFSRDYIVSELKNRDIKCFNAVVVVGCLVFSGLTTLAIICFPS